MAQIKSHTTLEQAKVLLKILPHQSADMSFSAEKGYKVMLHPYMASPWIGVPCWSLTALLSVLPNYQLQTQDDGIGILCSCNGKFNIVTADNPVDACYEMIIRLHELNLL